MSDHQIQPELDSFPRRRHIPGGVFGRAWVKHHLEFWQRCTVEHYDADTVTVTLDHLEELTVPHDHVQNLELEPGDLVFVKLAPHYIYGNPAFIVRVKDETAEVKYPHSIYGKTERLTVFLRDLQFYHELEESHWRKGAHVFAFRDIRFIPEMFLFFPGIVLDTQDEVLVHVEFSDGHNAILPTTLLEKPTFDPGDIVFTCTSYVSHAINPVASWGPCRVVERKGDRLVLQDGSGQPFETPINMITILPKGYRMIDGIFERIPANSEGAYKPTECHTVHVIRTEHWSSAASDPITREHVNALLASDATLAWTTGDRIAWHGIPCFWWNRHEIRSDRPSEKQLAKLIEIAIELDANVIGDDGREYH